MNRMTVSPILLKNQIFKKRRWKPVVQPWKPETVPVELVLKQFITNVETTGVLQQNSGFFSDVKKMVTQSFAHNQS